MDVYYVTDADRDLLLAGADLEALLAERESERLERDERTQMLLTEATVAHLPQETSQPREYHHLEARAA